MGKLFVILARDTCDAIIIRRGPSSWYHLISWNTKTDKLEHGAWIKGRIYEDRCDLSPDGKLFIYFVLKEAHNDVGLPNTWTAISRPPWLKALALWPHGDTYNGGGRFVGNREIILRPNCDGWGDVCHPDFPNSCVTILRGSDAKLQASSHLVEGANWSGYDRFGRIVYTLGDKVFRINHEGVESEIADFSELKPERVPAPDWACRAP